MSSQFPGDQPDPQPAPPSWTPSAPPQPASSVPAAGWYADPAGSGQLRYWDGGGWTAHLSPVPSAAPIYGAAPSYGVPAAYGGPGYAVAPRRVGFGDAVRMAFRNWKDFESRATLGEYWWFYLFQVLVVVVGYLVLAVLLAVVAAATGSTSGSSTSSSGGSAALGVVGVLLTLVFVAVSIVFFVVGLAVTVRRLHDTDRSGWWYLITLVPFGGIVLLVFLVGQGTPGPNQYGPVPV
ncbi:MAG: DUF805 domain-containing protein [Candidatus Nanopelagicales bacterium]